MTASILDYIFPFFMLFTAGALMFFLNAFIFYMINLWRKK